MRKKNIVILDSIRSLNNIGSIFRTCDSFNIKKLILCGICGTPPNREINKTALGATDFVTWEYEKNILTVITNLKNLNYTIISIEQNKESIDLKKYKPKKNEKLALIFGNEVKGISSNTISNSDCSIEIPQYGHKKSMNVAICVGIILWDIFLKQN
tara:strand:- start:119 stop:586 length:468 start_codon:yes stop_codon:yes gene_type:complete